MSTPARGGRGSNQYQSKNGSNKTDHGRRDVKGFIDAVGDNQQSFDHADKTPDPYGPDPNDPWPTPWTTPPAPVPGTASRSYRPNRERMVAAFAQYGDSQWAAALENPAFGPDAGDHPLPSPSNPSYLAGPSGHLATAAFRVDDQTDALRAAVDAAETRPTEQTISALQSEIGTMITARNELREQRRRTAGSCQSVDLRLGTSRRALNRAQRVARTLRTENALASA